jgi:ubiquinone biosynthesis protein
MLTHLPRLLAIWTIIARYRLDTLLPPPPGLRGTLLLCCCACTPHGGWLAPVPNTRPDCAKPLKNSAPCSSSWANCWQPVVTCCPPIFWMNWSSFKIKCLPSPHALAIAIVEMELGAPLNEKFSRFDEQPLAAASIAQVHTAALPDGQEVVVKILRPGVAAQIRQDMALLRDLTAWLETRFPALAQFHPHRIARDYEQTLLDETDLLREAANTRQMRQNFPDSDMLYVPAVHDAWCTQNIMVAERIYGVPIDDHACVRAPEYQSATTGRKRLCHFLPATP